MTWACELTEDAERDLRGLPKGIQKRVARTLTQMAANPFEGNVKALKGDEWRVCCAVASATTRIHFTADRAKHTVFVLRVLLRSEKSYR